MNKPTKKKQTGRNSQTGTSAGETRIQKEFVLFLFFEKYQRLWKKDICKDWFGSHQILKAVKSAENGQTEPTSS